MGTIRYEFAVRMLLEVRCLTRIVPILPSLFIERRKIKGTESGRVDVAVAQD